MIQLYHIRSAIAWDHVRLPKVPDLPVDENADAVEAIIKIHDDPNVTGADDPLYPSLNRSNTLTKLTRSPGFIDELQVLLKEVKESIPNQHQRRR